MLCKIRSLSNRRSAWNVSHAVRPLARIGRNHG
jgi:hypothetical protein